MIKITKKLVKKIIKNKYNTDQDLSFLWSFINDNLFSNKLDTQKLVLKALKFYNKESEIK